MQSDLHEIGDHNGESLDRGSSDNDGTNDNIDKRIVMMLQVTFVRMQTQDLLALYSKYSSKAYSVSPSLFGLHLLLPPPACKIYTTKFISETFSS